MSKFAKVWTDYVLIAVGTTLLALAIHLFYEPNGLVTGGVSGLGILIRTVAAERFGVNIPLWATNTVLNLPLFIAGAKVMGIRFLRRTLFATAYLSLALFVVGFLPAVEGADDLLAAVFGGAVSGLGLGLVFRCRATTGGTDLCAAILNTYYRHISVSKILLALDAAIVVLGFFSFGPTKAMAAVVAIFISAKASETILEGLDFAKAALIISDEADRIAERLLDELGRGVTRLSGKGMFTQRDKAVMLCVVSSKEVVALKDLVRKIDSAAFVIMADVREVLGEGFKNI